MATTTTEVATRASSAPAQTIKDFLNSDQIMKRIASAAANGIDAKQLVRVALMTISKTPALAQCDRNSLLIALLDAASMGLDVCGSLGQAYLVPYRDHGKPKAQLIIGYRGLIDLARRSGQIETITAQCVYEGERFRVSAGLSPDIEHEYNLDAERVDAKLIAAYAVARLKGGEVQYEVMTRKQIDAIRGRSRASASGPWVTDYAEMARKTVIRRLVKYLPLSIESRAAIEKMDASEVEIARPVEIAPSEIEVADASDGSVPADEAEAIDADAEVIEEPESEPAYAMPKRTVTEATS